jgi:hypothetical protein
VLEALDSHVASTDTNLFVELLVLRSTFGRVCLQGPGSQCTGDDADDGARDRASRTTHRAESRAAERTHAAADCFVGVETSLVSFGSAPLRFLRLRACVWQ